MKNKSWLKIPKGLKDIGKSYEELRELNSVLSEYQIDLFWLPRKGWRAFRQNGIQSQISWFGDGIALEWFEFPHVKANEFINKFCEGV